jgi:hypothetical protein
MFLLQRVDTYKLIIGVGYLYIVLIIFKDTHILDEIFRKRGLNFERN